MTADEGEREALASWSISELNRFGGSGSVGTVSPAGGLARTRWGCANVRPRRRTGRGDQRSRWMTASSIAHQCQGRAAAHMQAAAIGCEMGSHTEQRVARRLRRPTAGFATNSSHAELSDRITEARLLCNDTCDMYSSISSHRVSGLPGARTLFHVTRVQCRLEANDGYLSSGQWPTAQFVQRKRDSA